MQKSESITELAKALAKAQGEMILAKKGAENPFFKSRYADLGMTIDAIRAPLAGNGLAITQLIHPDSDHAVVETILMHGSGEWISSTIQLRPVKADPQGLGSAITYARRYALSAIVNLAAEDDDGEAATNHKAETKTAAKTETKTTAKTEAKTASKTGKVDSKSILLEIKSEAERAGIDPRREYDKRFGEPPTPEQLQQWLAELKTLPVGDELESPQDEPHDITWEEFWRYASMITGDKTPEQTAGMLGVKTMEDWTGTLDEGLEQLRRLCRKA
ncbi:MAG: hypothetical protein DDT33_01630 [Firmicutes bacterium]|nr:hypothetical protein [Bacillota bacterium]